MKLQLLNRVVHISRTSNIESDNSQNGGLEDYNNISDGIFPYINNQSIRISLGTQKEFAGFFKFNVMSEPNQLLLSSVSQTSSPICSKD